MNRIVLLVVVCALIVLVVGGTLLYSRYFLTPSYQQRIVEQQGTPIIVSTATP
jgi:hypothetical protein